MDLGGAEGEIRYGDILPCVCVAVVVEINGWKGKVEGTLSVM